MLAESPLITEFLFAGLLLLLLGFASGFCLFRTFTSHRASWWVALGTLPSLLLSGSCLFVFAARSEDWWPLWVFHGGNFALALTALVRCLTRRCSRPPGPRGSTLHPDLDSGPGGG